MKKTFALSQIKSIIDNQLTELDQTILYGLYNNDWTDAPTDNKASIDAFRELRAALYAALIHTIQANGDTITELDGISLISDKIDVADQGGGK